MAPLERHYCVYILGSSSGTLYVGVTNSIARRIEEHKQGVGSEFTSRYGVDRLLYIESFQYVNNAITREKVIKGWRRSKKVALIESGNPNWRDLSRDLGREFPTAWNQPASPCRPTNPSTRRASRPQ